MDYRKDIQILRGISVLLVVLYHLEIKGFQSGFLGVDVFFVISGYLMAILYDSANIKSFFAKRAKRLLPAYFITVLTVMVLTIIFVSPNEYIAVVQQALFALGFLSNFGYWLENSYFNKDIFHPLLHLWSLGVEIQFYLLLPFFVWAFRKIKGSYFLVLFGSLVLCMLAVGISSKTAFFITPFRLWEFLIGYGVAMKFPKPASTSESPLRWVGAFFVVILMLIPIISVDGNNNNFVYGHPGLSALFVCLVTAGVLIIGLPATFESLRLSALLEKLGEYSYSIYLVHFPVIVFFLYEPFSGTILQSKYLWQVFFIVGFIIVFSILMNKFVENHFRLNEKNYRLVMASALFTIVLMFVGNQVQAYTYTQQELLIYKARQNQVEYRCGKINRLLNPLGVLCEVTEVISNPVHRILLIGDSHADSIKSTFVSVAESKNTSVFFVVGNEPLIDSDYSAEIIIDEALKNGVNSFVVHYWSGGINVFEIQKLVNLASVHKIFIAFIMPVPTWPESVPKMLIDQVNLNQPLPVQTLGDYKITNNELFTGLTQIPTENFRIYEIGDIFCKDICTVINSSGYPLYFDGGHLTLAGSSLLSEKFSQIIDDLIMPSVP